MKDEVSELEALRTLAAPLLKQAGLPGDGWSARVISRREDGVMHRVVARLEAEGRTPLAVKHVLRPRDGARLAAQVARQNEVAATMPGSPRALAHDGEAQVVVMEFASGRTLYDLFSEGLPAEHARYLRLAGQWVDAFHRSGRTEARRFRPKFTLDHLSALRARVVEGKVAVPRRRAFLALLDRVVAQAPPAERCETIAAGGHGDLNLRNLLIDGEAVRGLDFATPGVLPVAHDLARLFCHYGTLCAPDVERQGPLPGVDLRPFFEGYRLVGEEDASLAFMCRVRLLRDWQTIPKASVARSLAQRVRFRGILRLAERAMRQGSGRAG